MISQELRRLAEQMKPRRLIAGTYRPGLIEDNPYKNWLIFVGPMGTWPKGSTYRQAWRHASGFELAALGRAVYVAWS